VAEPAVKGFFTPNIPSGQEDRTIDEGDLSRSIPWLIDQGVGGLSFNASSGVVEIVARETRGGAQILDGTVDPNIDIVLTAGKHFADLGCQAVSITGSHDFKVSRERALSAICGKSPRTLRSILIPPTSRRSRTKSAPMSSSDRPRIARESSARKPAVATCHAFRNTLD